MSGSMSSIIEKARKGFNTFLKEQKKSGNKINFSLMFFDTNFYMPYKGVDINEVKKVDEKTYYAGGVWAAFAVKKDRAPQCGLDQEITSAPIVSLIRW